MYFPPRNCWRKMTSRTSTASRKARHRRPATGLGPKNAGLIYCSEDTCQPSLNPHRNMCRSPCSSFPGRNCVASDTMEGENDRNVTDANLWRFAGVLPTLLSLFLQMLMMTERPPDHAEHWVLVPRLLYYQEQELSVLWPGGGWNCCWVCWCRPAVLLASRPQAEWKLSKTSCRVSLLIRLLEDPTGVLPEPRAGKLSYRN